jgi:PBSX family phage terminase large subunit
MMAPTLIELPYEPTERQLEAAQACLDPSARVISLDGAYRSAKTQAGARVLVDWALEHRSQYLVARATYRSLHDSTQKAIMFGDGGLPPLLPKEAIRRYRASDETVTLKNGSEILFRSLEVENTEKLRGLTLGGILIDQVEELDGGVAGERIWDTLLGRLSDPRGPRKLIAISNPAGLTHWLYRRVVNPRTRDKGVAHVHFRMTDNPHLPADYIAEMMATRETRPHWFRSFVEGTWGSFEGQAYEEFDPAVHVFEPFVMSSDWERALSLDHGAANPTAVHAWAVDFDGNVLAFGEYYEAGQLVSDHARAIRHRCKESWTVDGRVPVVIADPSTGAKSGIANKWGQPASVKTEYAEHGVHLYGANNDRAAGYLRLLELVRPDPRRLFPSWHRRSGEHGSPRLFIASSCEHLVEQFKSAPVAEDGVGAGECVDPKWESSFGHAHASARYFCLTRPSPSPVPAAVLIRGSS